VVNHIIDKLNKRFGEYTSLSTSTGKKLDYLGMTLDYTTKGKVTLSMYEYINKMLAELPSDMKGVSKTPPRGIYSTSTLTRQNCQKTKHSCSII